ncbi:MAG: hypothetical protein AB7I19_14545 [Planctomycetota bacterium]
MTPWRIPESLTHPFYMRANELPNAAKFDEWTEASLGSLGGVIHAADRYGKCCVLLEYRYESGLGAADISAVGPLCGKQSVCDAFGALEGSPAEPKDLGKHFGRPNNS